MIAYQLTLIDSAIFLEIDPHSLLAHSTKNPDPKIIASTDFFNYLTRIVECSILSPVEASSRALVIHHWVKVAAKLHELHNFQTLKAILSALDDNGGDQEIEDPLSEFTTEEIKETIDKYVTTVAGLKRSITLYREIIYKVASDPDILEFAPHMIAYQLTLIDSAIFLEIDPHSLLAHSTKNPDPKIIASTDFFNYLTRIVECSILSPVEASSRALVIHHWVKVAAKLHELHNFQTLKAILSALGTPPIKRLKRTWTCIPKKSMVKLDSLNEMMSESSNYEKYRETIQPEIFSRKPIVPFLGTFIMDATYLSAAIRNSASSSINSPLISLSMTSTTTNSDDSDSGNGNKNNNITGNSCFTHPISRSMSLPSSPEKILTLQDDSRVQELLHTMFRYQNGPKYQPIPPMSYIKASTKHHFRATSLGAALHRGSVIRYHNRNDDDNEIIKEKQQIITHYLLTRTWIPEKSVDELSLQREPHKQKSSQDGINKSYKDCHKGEMSKKNFSVNSQFTDGDLIFWHISQQTDDESHDLHYMVQFPAL
ncbi:14940_t:CDS:2, partial [Entrophospora sp. SA101]